MQAFFAHNDLRAVDMLRDYATKGKIWLSKAAANDALKITDIGNLIGLGIDEPSTAQLLEQDFAAVPFGHLLPRRAEDWTLDTVKALMTWAKADAEAWVSPIDLAALAPLPTTIAYNPDYYIPPTPPAPTEGGTSTPAPSTEETGETPSMPPPEQTPPVVETPPATDTPSEPASEPPASDTTGGPTEQPPSDQQPPTEPPAAEEPPPASDPSAPSDDSGGQNTQAGGEPQTPPASDPPAEPETPLAVDPKDAQIAELQHQVEATKEENRELRTELEQEKERNQELKGDVKEFLGDLDKLKGDVAD
jgi:hypothetical protein